MDTAVVGDNHGCVRIHIQENEQTGDQASGRKSRGVVHDWKPGSNAGDSE